MDYVRTMLHGDNWHLTLTRDLLQNSDRPLEFDGKSTLSGYTKQFCFDSVRWETLGIFLSAVIRANFDVSFFPSLYTTESGREELRKSAARLSAICLELCLSLDCLNDLQLVLQYESFIVHTYIDGDQSKCRCQSVAFVINTGILLGIRSWRSLGDVIASAFALGYHENAQSKPEVPPFLVELRQTAFARMYSADKNVAIFLGRPPRMSKRFSCFQIPSGRAYSEIESSGLGHHHHALDWDHNLEISYRAESRWSAQCASIKEDILELLFEQDRGHDAQKARSVVKLPSFATAKLPSKRDC